MWIRHGMTLNTSEPIYSKSQVGGDGYPTYLEANLCNMDGVQKRPVGLFACKLGGYCIQGQLCVRMSDTIGNRSFACGRSECGCASGFACTKCLDSRDGQIF